MHKYKSVDFQFDPEIERTARRLRREHRELQAAVTMDDLQDLRNLNRREGIQPVNVHEGLNGQYVQRQPGNNNIIHMANDRDRAIRDYAVLTPQAIHPGIVRPDVQADNFELKPVMFQMLQTVGQFNGLSFEDPHLHLKLFLEVSDAFKIAGASQEALRLGLFPFSLRDRARAWLNSLPPDSITTWSDLADKFLLKYFLPTKNTKLRNEITSFHQLENESLCDAWEKFKELLRKCPHHGIPYCIQLETFYNGLNPSTRLMVDTSANGALLSKSYNEAYEILERIANNNYQWPSTRQAAARGTTGVHNVDTLTALSAQVTSLTRMVKAMTTAPATINQISDLSCVYCGEGHLFDNCPGNPTSVNYQNQEQRSINNDQLSSLEGLIKDYIVRNEAVVQSHTVSLRNLENQIGQLATALSNRPQGSLPVIQRTQEEKGKSTANSATTSVESYDPAPGSEEATAPTATDLSRAKEKQSAQPAAAQQFRHPPPFPQRFQKQQQDKQFSKILGMLKQLHINIPFVEVLEQMPNYAKFLKDILTKKRRLGEFETIALTQESSRMLQSKIPQKMKDPGSFTIPCSIGTKYSGKALCDLGASINLMPLSVFKQLGVGECRPTTVTLQLADRSHVYPEEKIEDVLVKVDKFIFPVDFIVLDFEADKEVPIILGRPFLATGKTLIDVQKGELTMRVNDQQVTFNVLDAMKSPDEIEDCNFISAVDFVVAERLHSCCSKEEINAVTIEELDDKDHGAANIAWSGEKQPFRINEQIQQRELTPDQQEFKVNGPRVKHYMGDDMNSLKNDRFLKDPG
ncbi:uncharacterized protein LOC127902982 [Citrus sinensis]|uniref:uncharacterized protein LOC127902982 n=1 Tax=Citrus sinensis TaxID=2711 RepID=UPI00227812FB|nr:uncharacterized protein LOC127902982 [Citrus sinensis]